jgi:hypothetical protein
MDADTGQLKWHFQFTPHDLMNDYSDLHAYVAGIARKSRGPSVYVTESRIDYVPSWPVNYRS